MVDVTKRAPTPATFVPPKRHMSPSLFRFAPRTFTMTPPIAGPRLGAMLSTVGASKYSKTTTPSNCEPSCLKPKVTLPDALKGAMHTTVKASRRIPDTVFPPKMHSVRVARASKLLPVTVTIVPPSFGPLVGSTKTTLPVAPYMNPTRPVPASTPLLLTTTPTVPAPRDGATHDTTVDDM